MKPSTPYGRAKASSALRNVNRGSAQDLTTDNQELAAVIVIVIVALALLRHLAAAHGLGVTPDSAAYFSAAENLLRGRGLVLFDGRPMTLWPPLYPALVGALSVLFSPMTAAKVLNGACLAGSILLAWGWSRRAFGRAAGVAAAAGIAFSPVLLMSCMAWSEPLFLMLTVAGLSAVDRYRADGRGLYRAAIFIGLAALTRYTGVTLIMAGALLVLAGPVGGRRLRDVAAFVLLSATPLGLWLCRNWVVAHTLTGPRFPAEVGLVKALGQAAVAVAGWAPVDFAPLGLALVALGAVAGTALILLTLNEDKTRFVQAQLLFALVYLVMIVGSGSRVAMDPIGARLVSPLYPAMLMLMAGGLYCLPLVWPARGTRALMAAGLVILPLFFGARVARMAPEIITHGPGGYARPEFRDSPTLAWLRAHPQPQPIVSNEPGSIYWLTRQPALLSPARHPYRSRKGPADNPAALSRSLGGTVVLFSFGESRFFSADELARVAPLSLVERFEDGAVYRISFPELEPVIEPEPAAGTTVEPETEPQR